MVTFHVVLGRSTRETVVSILHPRNVFPRFCDDHIFNCMAVSIVVKTVNRQLNKSPLSHEARKFHEADHRT